MIFRLHGVATPLIVAAILFLAWDYVHEATFVRWPGDWLGPDSYLALWRVRFSEGEYPALAPLTGNYLSQFGLQGVVLSALFPFWPGNSVAAYSLFSAQIVSLLTALTLAPVSVTVWRAAGPVSAFAFVFAAAFSPWLAKFAHSLYWVPFLLVAPLTYGALLGHAADAPGRTRWLFLAGVALLIALKALCGYEYITFTALIACAGYALSCAARGVPLRITPLALIFTATVIGFLFALALHVIQIIAWAGPDGINVLLDRAAERTASAR